MSGINTKIMRGTHPDMHITPRTGRARVRCVGQIAGLGNGKEYGVHNPTLVNLRRGLMERVFYVEGPNGLTPPPKPKPGAFKRLAYFKRRLHSIIGSHSPISREDFVSMYQGRRKTIFEDANTSLGSTAVCRRDSYLSTFIKAEKLPLYKKPDPAPRVIQPRSPRYNIEVGKFLKPFEHHLYRAIDNIFGGPTIIKGYTVDEIGNIMAEAWGQFRSPVAIGYDFKRFDQHVSAHALQYEHNVYLQAFHNDPELARLLSWQINNKGFANVNEGRIRYKTSGCRMSGDMNTAMGNCLLACSMTHYMLRGLKYRLLNNGDDCVVITERENQELVLETLPRFVEFGFQCVGEEPVYTLEHLEFCNLKPLHMGRGEYMAIRNPSVSLSKDTYCVSGWTTEKEAIHWLNAIGQCGESIVKGVPVLQEYYRCLTRNFHSSWLERNSHKLDSGFYRLAMKGSKRRGTNVSPEARFSFYVMTGVTPDEQTAQEARLASLTFQASWSPEGNFDQVDHYERLF